MELRRADSDGVLAMPGRWAGSVRQRRSRDLRVCRRAARRPRAWSAPSATTSSAVTCSHACSGTASTPGALRIAPGRATALAMVAYDDAGGRDFHYSVRGSAAEAVDGRAAVACARADATLDPRLGVEHRVRRPARRRPSRRPSRPDSQRRRPASRSTPTSVPTAHAGGARSAPRALARQASVVFPSAGELGGPRAHRPPSLVGLRRARLRDATGPRGVESHSAAWRRTGARSPRPRVAARSTRPARATPSPPPSVSSYAARRRARARRRRPRVRWPPTALRSVALGAMEAPFAGPGGLRSPPRADVTRRAGRRSRRSSETPLAPRDEASSATRLAPRRSPRRPARTRRRARPRGFRRTRPRRRSCRWRDLRRRNVGPDLPRRPARPLTHRDDHGQTVRELAARAAIVLSVRGRRRRSGRRAPACSAPARRRAGAARSATTCGAGFKTTAPLARGCPTTASSGISSCSGPRPEPEPASPGVRRRR